MEITQTYGFSAPPENVFDVMTDPDRAGRWLPDGVQVSAGADLRAEWVCAHWPQLSGSAHVRDGGSGDSEVDVVIRGDGIEPDASRIRTSVQEAVENLRRAVSDNFTAG
jgi:uncharacterized protein YndB with AHSA1/START domain